MQAARHFGAGRIVAAGRNPQLLARLPALGADATIQLDQPAAALRAAFAAGAGDGGYDVVADYLWGRPAEVFLSTIERHDAVPRSGRVRMIQLGDMAGPAITLSAAVLRSAGVELTGGGSGTMPAADVLAAMLGELLDLLGSGQVRIGIERVPLASVGDVWTRDQGGRRPVFIP